MNWIIDGVLAALILIFAIVGYKKGFTGQIGGFIILIGSLVLAFLFYKLIAGYVGGITFISDIEGKLLAWLNSKGELFETNIRTGGEEAVKSALTSMNIPNFLQDLILKAIDFENLPDKSIAEYLAPLMFKYICYAIAFLLIFIVSLIVIALVVKLIKKIIDDIPVIGFLNKIIGLGIGVAKVVIAIWLIMYGMTLLCAIPSIGDTITNVVNNYVLTTYVGKFLYEHNYLITLISKLF